MKQICDGYNPRVLMGNWYQQLHSVPQPSRDQLKKVARQTQIDIGFADHKGKLRPLNTISRQQPWNTQNLVSAPQYRNQNQIKKCTISKQNFDLSTVNKFHKKWKPLPFTKQNNSNEQNKLYVKVDKFNNNFKLFNQRTVNELLAPRQSDQKSFRSQIKPFVPADQSKLLCTIYQQDISRNNQISGSSTNFKYRNSSKNSLQQTGQNNKVANFRRIRSEITLQTITNFPLTYK